MWTSSSCLVKPYQTCLWICVIRPLDQVTEPEPVHFDQIISLKSLLINLFLLARLNLGLQLIRLPVQASQEALCSERARKRERERRLFKWCRNLLAGHCAAGVQAVKAVSDPTSHEL